MRNLLTIFIVFLFFSFDFAVLSYGQSGCADWGSPLEQDISNDDVISPFDTTQKHYGTDYKAADGDNVLAVADGTILKNDYSIKNLNAPDPRTGLMVKGWGRYLAVKHKDGSTTLYAHLQENSTSNLSEGQEVTKGTIIGKADSTGGVTGSHLHLEYAPDGKWWYKPSKVNPHPCIVQCDPQSPVVLAISGPDAPVNGSRYTATGGTAPYTWSISKGSITQDGIITVSGQCGTATVTAQDSCGNQATKEIRMSLGMWIYVSQICPYQYCYTMVGSLFYIWTVSPTYGYCDSFVIRNSPQARLSVSSPVGLQYTSLGYPACILCPNVNFPIGCTFFYEWRCP